MKVQSILSTPPSYLKANNLKAKANATQGGLGVLTATNPSNLLTDTNYNRAFIHSNSVSFKGADPILPVVGGINPSEDKINTALGFVGTNDIVVVAKDVETARQDLLDSTKTMSKVVSRVLFVQDESAKGSFMFANDMYNNPYVQNIGRAPFYQETKDGAYKLLRGDHMFLRDNAEYRSGRMGVPFKVSPNNSATVDELNKSGVEIFDFKSLEQNQIININKQRLSTMGVLPEIKKEPKKLTFADVGGQDKAINELKKAIVYPIKYPDAFKIMNHGVLLEGGPGTGKTLIAEALANEVDASFIKLNGLEMVSKWSGESEENMRNLFEEARSKQPCIVFIDEFDAIARKREGSEISRHDDKMVNQLLTLMSDLEKQGDSVYVIAATNRKEIIDDAVLRSGRFGKQILVPNPDLDGCKMIFDIHTKKKQMDKSIDTEEFVKTLHSKNVSGADIADIVERAQNAAYLRDGVFEKMENGTFNMSDIEKLEITQEDLDAALEEFSAQTKIEEEKPRNPIGFIWPTDKK